MRKKIFITREIPGNAIDFLSNHFDVKVNSEDRVLLREELIENIKGVDGVLCLLQDIIDKDIIDNASKAKIFANYAVGYNNIDVKYAREKGIIITNTPGVLTDTTAELAWALLLSVARRVVDADKYVREGKFTEWKPNLYLGQDITGKTLGIIGAGSIGKAFAKRSLGYDMKIIYHNRKRDLAFEEEFKARWVDKETLCKDSDIISIHVPLTEETTYLITKKELDIMKETAIIINTARGPVIEEKALYEALKNKKIWGAGLDVYEKEPEIYPGLTELDNVVLAPHIGSATIETRERMAMMAAMNIEAVLNGREPITPVKLK